MHTTGRIIAVAVPAAANGEASAGRAGPRVERGAGSSTDLLGPVPASIGRLSWPIEGAVTDLVAAGTVG